MVASKPSPLALAAPRGASVAGIIFSVLMVVGYGLVRFAIPTDLRAPGTWLTEPFHRAAMSYALDLVPFGGVAFLWFIGVLRNRLGELEDQLFATVFLGSGLLFVACVFGGAAVMKAVIESVTPGNVGSETYYFGRGVGDALLNLFAIKMASVFIFTTCTIGLRTAIFPRWVAYSGFACGVLLLLIIANWRWITLVFPIWLLLVSIEILISEFRSRGAASAVAESSTA